MEVKRKIRQPAHEKLPHNKYKCQCGFAPSKRPVPDISQRSGSCRDYGRLAVDRVRSVFVWRPRGKWSPLTSSNSCHFINATIDSKNNQRWYKETQEAEEGREDSSVVTVAPVLSAVGGADVVVAPAGGGPPQNRRQAQSQRDEPHSHHDDRGEAEGHLHLVAHGVHDVVVPLHADDGDGEDGGGDKGHVEENVHLQDKRQNLYHSKKKKKNQ